MSVFKKSFLAVMILLLSLSSIAFAAYPKEKSHETKGEIFTIRKSAEWTDSSQKEARVRIEVETKDGAEELLEKQLYIIIVVDDSISTNATSVKQAIKDVTYYLLNGKNSKDKIGIVKFGGGATIKSFTSNPDEIIKYLSKDNRPSLSTNLSGAYNAIDILEEEAKKDKRAYPVVIWFTDGLPVPGFNTGAPKEWGDPIFSNDQISEYNKAVTNYREFMEARRQVSSPEYLIWTGHQGGSYYDGGGSGMIMRPSAIQSSLWENYVKKVIGDTTTDNDIGQELIKLVKDIRKRIKVSSEIKATINDVINYNLFEYVSSKAKVKTNVGKVSNVSFNSRNNSISWNISGVEYGEKIKGEWPYIEFNIQVKSSKTSFDSYNTNYIKDLVDNDDKVIKGEDNNCNIFSDAENLPIKSPWLSKSHPKLHINYVRLDGNGKVQERYASFTMKKEIGNATYNYKSLNMNAKVNSPDYIKKFSYDIIDYIGFEVQDGIVLANDIKEISAEKMKKLNKSSVASYSLPKADSEKTITIYFGPKKSEIRFVHVCLYGQNQYMVIPGEGYSGTLKEEFTYDKNGYPTNIKKTISAQINDESVYKYKGLMAKKGKNPSEVFIIKNVNELNEVGKLFPSGKKTGEYVKYVNRNYMSGLIQTIDGRTENKSYNMDLSMDSKYCYVVFVYELVPTDFYVEIAHYNTSTGEEIYKYPRNSTRARYNLNEFVKDLLSDSVKAEISKRNNNPNYTKKDFVKYVFEQLNKTDNSKIPEEFKSLQTGKVINDDVEFLLTGIDVDTNSGSCDIKKTFASSLSYGTPNSNGVYNLPLKDVSEKVVSGNIEYDETRNTLVIRYNYIEKKTNKVVVRYVDSDTNEEIKTRIERRIPNGEEYDAHADDVIRYKDFDYKYLGYCEVIKEDGSKTRHDVKDITVLLDQNIEIIFYYKCELNNVKVKYVDIDTGNPVKDEVTGKKQSGDKYDAHAEDVIKYDGLNYKYLGYCDVEKNGSTTSYDVSDITVVLDQDIVITFYYKTKYEDVKVRYVNVDTDKDITTPIEDSKPNGESYTADSRESDFSPEYEYIGYCDVKKIEDGTSSRHDVNEITVILDQTIEIIFYYKKVPTPEIIPNIVPSETPDLTDEPESPYNDSRLDGKLLVLDEMFELLYDIENYNAITIGEVKAVFPFDVYCFEPNGKTGTNGKFIKAGEEFTLEEFLADNYEERKLVTDTETRHYYFRLPSWVVERFPSVLVDGSLSNCYDAKITLVYETELTTGPLTKPKTVQIGVIGTVYDFTVTNVSEGEAVDNWNRSLFTGGNLGREYKADTLPIAQAEIHPNISKITDLKASERKDNTKPVNWNRGLLLGSKFLFTINTKGLKSNSIKIIPKLTYYDTNGNVVEGAVFKYGELGSAFSDSEGLVLSVGTHFKTSLNDRLRDTAELRDEKAKTTAMISINEKFNETEYKLLECRNLVNQYKTPQFTTEFDFGSYGKLIIPNGLRLPYVNYTSVDLYKSEVNKIGGYIDTSVDPVRVDDSKRELQYLDYGYANSSNNNEYLSKISEIGINEFVLINSLGHWYAEYSLPSSLIVCDSSGNKLSGGSILVSFKISTMDEAGNTYLSYNKQWKKENSAINYSGSGKIVKLSLPHVNKVVDYDMTSGYYPVAIYSTNNIEFVISGGTH